jgi:GntR family transcriptional repressor for pyruvate dehydrogenase complex
MLLNRTLVPQSAAREIQDMIQSGELPAGQKIPSQRDFSIRQFGISRASLREALLTLETLGLLKTEAGRGTFVAGTRPSSGQRAMAPWRYSEQLFGF